MPLTYDLKPDLEEYIQKYKFYSGPHEFDVGI